MASWRDFTESAKYFVRKNHTTLAIRDQDIYPKNCMGQKKQRYRVEKHALLKGGQ